MIDHLSQLFDIVKCVVDVEQFATPAQLEVVLKEAKSIMDKVVRSIKNNKQDDFPGEQSRLINSQI